MRRHPVRAVTLSVLFLAAAWAGWFVASRVSAEPGVEWSPVERLNELVASRQPEGADAWPIYERILREDLGIEDPWRQTGNDLYDTLRWWRQRTMPLTGEWSDSTWESDRARFETLRFLLHRLDDAAAAPGCAQPKQSYPQDGMHGQYTPFVLLPELAPLRDLGRLNTIGLRAAAEAQDWDEVVRRAAAGQALGRHFTYQPSTLEWIVGGGGVAETHAELRKILMEHDVPAFTCERLLAIVHDTPWPALPMSELFAGERIAAGAIVQILYSPGDRGFMVYHAILDHPGMDSIVNPLGTHFLPDEPRFLLRMTNLHPRMIALPSRGSVERAIEDVFSEVAALLSDDSFDLDEIKPKIDRIREQHIALTDVMRAIPGAVALLAPHLTGQQALVIMLHLEIHHARTGRWPDSLLELIAHEQTIDPVTGLAFEYERMMDDPDGRPYVLRAPAPYPSPPTIRTWPEMNPVRELIPLSVLERRGGR